SQARSTNGQGGSRRRNAFLMERPRGAGRDFTRRNWRKSRELGLVLRVLERVQRKHFALQPSRTNSDRQPVRGPSFCRGRNSIGDRLGLVYWLLLDLLQGAYPLDEVGRASVPATFGAIGLFAVSIWVAAYRSSWRLPRILD